jgi:hypothetical protein
MQRADTNRQGCGSGAAGAGAGRGGLGARSPLFRELPVWGRRRNLPDDARAVTSDPDPRRSAIEHTARIEPRFLIVLSSPGQR